MSKGALEGMAVAREEGGHMVPSQERDDAGAQPTFSFVRAGPSHLNRI